MKYDPAKHHRRSIRLKGYDYAQAGAYFVTILARHGECVFGKVTTGQMRLNAVGQAAARVWQALPYHFPGVTLDGWVMMPNHMHGIVILAGEVGGMRKGEASAPGSPDISDTRRADASPLPERPHGTAPRSLGAIVQNFKSVSTRRINALRQTPGQPVWQRNYYEHVIRGETDLQRIRQYIVNNPAKWHEDENNPNRP
ncbi:MAG TPA: transposase [Anaerolineales bacterium]|nr:transposase [Anaerolineales bacterium]